MENEDHMILLSNIHDLSPPFFTHYGCQNESISPQNEHLTMFHWMCFLKILSRSTIITRLVVNAENTLGHLDQYPAQHGCIVMQSYRETV